MNVSRFAVVLVIFLTLLISPTYSANAFFDDFNNGPSPMWGNNRGDWYGHDGVYDTLSPNNMPPTVSLLPMNLTDFAVDADVNGISDGGIWLRSSYSESGISGVLLVTGGTNHTGHGFYWHIVREDGYSENITGTSPLFEQGDNVHIRVLVSSNTYSCYLNGSLTPCTTLTTDEFSSGQVGLYNYSGQTFDNFSVSTGIEVGRSLVSKVDAAYDPIMETASGNFRFTFVGKVTTIDQDSFWLNDGSKQSIRVVVPNYSGLADGDWVRATGMITFESNVPVIPPNDLTHQDYPVVPAGTQIIY